MAIKTIVTSSLVIIPTSDGPMKPGVVEIQFDSPIIIPAYLGAMSSGFTMNPVKESPKKATAMHINATVTSDRSGNPDKMINVAEPTIPEKK